ncbi:hypothetical protein NEHOM01_0696 [Nematocida homosporus]|uniref:uncharacterized protein n=1 Tax=Nematocida homosporus TaxID=1912981 RepID=UPI00221F4DDB|nr:uncharacterized protein NEHOM01_0696 [Nematocida homosporus]KAI5185238.1 hypothetical protein NEHOM01_0696 [Nematocida homosporus]
MLKSMFIESMNQPITNWLNLNYVACKDGSIPRCIIYQHYCEDFKKEGIMPLNTAMFGKVIKMTFPSIRSRRLGNRGNSKYHYFGVAARNVAPAGFVPEETLSEAAFLKKYESVHKTVLDQFLENDYVLAYQEMKTFWCEVLPSFGSSKSLEYGCIGIERGFFEALAKRCLADVNASGRPISALKTAAKTIAVLCKQIVGISSNKAVVARMESYKQRAMALNSLGNLYRCASVLEEKHALRDSLEEFLFFLDSGVSLLQECVPLEKSHFLHSSGRTLISFYVASASFQEFAGGLGDMLAALLRKKERVHYAEIEKYFTEMIQEVAASSLCCLDLSSAICAFFSEYFGLLANGLAFAEIFQKREMAKCPAPTSPPKESVSFVSQIITSTD